MPASPVEAEALNQEFIAATFSGSTFRLPLDVDSWPLDAIKTSVLHNTKTHVVVVNHLQLATALEQLLGDQWPAFLRVARKRKQLVAASQNFAAAAGIPATDKALDRAFGGIPRLLSVLDMWPGKVESDLDRFWDIDYRDRWRFDGNQHRRLTLRRIFVRFDNLPHDSAVAVALNGGSQPLSDSAKAVMDLYEGLLKVRHPSRPMTKAEIAARQAKAEADAREAAKHQKKMAGRAARLQAQAIDNARANARREQQREEAHGEADQDDTYL